MRGTATSITATKPIARAAECGQREVETEAEILLDDELADLTGYKHRSHQRNWLKESELIGAPGTRKTGTCRQEWCVVSVQRKMARSGSAITTVTQREKTPLGTDLSKARLKWAELEAKEKPADLTTMKGLFDRYARDVITEKRERTQKDSMAELKQLRPIFYANAAVWDAVYAVAGQELEEAMELGYLIGQLTADVLIMRNDDTEGDYFLVTQGKTGQKLRILMRTEAGENSWGRLVREISERNFSHSTKYLLINRHEKRITKGKLRLRWETANRRSPSGFTGGLAPPRNPLNRQSPGTPAI